MHTQGRAMLVGWVGVMGMMGCLSLAQAQDPRRGAAPNQRLMDPRDHSRPAMSPSAPANNCVVERSIMMNHQQQLDNARAEMAGVDSEMQTLRRRMDDLERRRQELSMQTQNYQQQYSAANAAYGQRCAASESCSDYETRVAQLAMESRPLQDQMSTMRNEINNEQNGMGNINGQTNSLRNEYAQRNCANMVPGQTSQEDIDRCSQIFSEWNRMQMAVNQSNSRLPTLRSRYEQLAMQQDSINRRAQDLRSNMNRMCNGNPHINDLNQYATVMRDASAMHDQLERLAADAARLAQVRINAQH